MNCTCTNDNQMSLYNYDLNMILIHFNVFIHMATLYRVCFFPDKGKRMKCPYCVKTFVHKFRMLEHIQIYHIERDSPSESDPTWNVFSPHPDSSWNKGSSTSTPKRKRGRKPKPKTTTKLDVPEFQQDVEPQISIHEITSAPADMSWDVSTDTVVVKEEPTSDTVNTVTEYTDVLKVIL